MPLEDMTAKQILDAASKHLVLFGKFSRVDDGDRVKTYDAETLRKKEPLKFELCYDRESPSKIDGWQTFEAFGLKCPKDAGKGSKSLPIGGSPLENALQREGMSKEEVGGQIFIELLDALDALSPFYHPNFDRLLTEGFYYYTKEKKRNGNFYTDPSRRRLLYKPRLNQALLGYLRAGASDSEKYFKAFRNELRKQESEKDLTELISDELQNYRNALGTEIPDEGAVHSLYEEYKNWERFSKDFEIPKHKGKKLQQLYRDFREAAEKIEVISRCEPLIALVISWYFGKLSDVENQRKIAETLYQEVYEKSKGWKPRLSPKFLDEDQETFRSALDERYCQIVDEQIKSGGVDSPLAILFKRVMVEAVDHRGRTWKVSRSYVRDMLIDDTVRRFLFLSVEAIEGVPELIQEVKSFLDDLKPIYRSFEESYLTPESLDSQKMAEILSDLPEEFKDWKEAFLKECQDKNKKGEELGDLFRESFNKQKGLIEGNKAEKFYKDNKEAIEKKQSIIDAVYRSQLQAMTEEDAVPVAGGALLGIGDPEKMNEDAERGTREIHKGQLEKVARKMAAGGGSSRQPETDQGAETDEEAKKSEKEDEAAEAVVSNRIDEKDEIRIDFSEESLKSSFQNVKDENELDEKLDLYAKELEKGDAELERIKGLLIQTKFLSDNSKAPARGVLRSNMLGEFLLSAPGELSPLGEKDTSLGVALLLEIVEHVGAKTDYEGQDRQSLARPAPDLDCGVRSVNLPGIWQITKGEDGKDQLVKLVAYWQDLAKEVFSVREYVEDMKIAQRLIQLMRNCDGGYLTVVNETVEEHASRLDDHDDRLEMFNSVDSGKDIPPPGVVYISNQAFGKGKKHTLKSFHPALLGTDDSSAISQIVTGNTGKIMSFPVFLGRKIADSRMPVVELNMLEISSLCICLCDPENEALKEELGQNIKKYREATGTKLGKKNSEADLWKDFLRRDQNLEALLKSKVLSHAFFQLCLEAQAPDGIDAVYEAESSIANAIGRVYERITLMERDGKTWTRMPPLKDQSDFEIPRLSVGGSEISQLESIFVHLTDNKI